MHFHFSLNWFFYLLAYFALVTSVNGRNICRLTASGGDDAPQFLAAAASCGTVTIPEGTTLNISTRLNMTAMSNFKIDLQGTIFFNPDIPYWTGNAFQIPFQNQSTFWLLGGDNIVLSGGGTLDGAGQAWYDAFAVNASLFRPVILVLNEASNALVDNIRMVNSPEFFNFVNECQNVTYSNINLSAVSTSDNFIANTDGWDIYRSNNITIKDSIINNGDDCVAFKPNSTNILVSNLNCNGSHGISVGSLGEFEGVFDIVQNVLAIDIQIANAENGARIKAFAGSGVGSGMVQNITYQNFVVSNVDSPVVIDQCYETTTAACEEFPSNVIIQDVFFNNISGTGSSSTVATLDCSPDARCTDINVNNLSLTGPNGAAPKYECQNVNLTGNAVSLFGDCTTD
ncbi:pectin lyase fold/virulence factor [Rhodocollybia butyracea]|uniref:galacturonan 1,4-alpha-galacturonidase n=1 Tax=Rhodocollybia butyracea TaxID=206335 RepID=A0A9P5QBK8_9AGAR|nr:pectin lyase fold/virulence factor [Rhodocollybia butyracea]